MLNLPRESWWRRLWEERGCAVARSMGETIPPGEVTPFVWNNLVLPGACGLTFGPRAGLPHFTFMTLGITQPLDPGDVTPDFEFALKTKQLLEWPQQVLYDLLTWWLTQKPELERGAFLPLVFFFNANAQLSAGLSDHLDNLPVAGCIRGLYLWDDLDQVRFSVSSGEFRLMVAVAVTADEIALADETTPPHLLLLLKRMGVGQLSDPLRKSVLTMRRAKAEWSAIRVLSHDQAVAELQG